MKAIDHRQENKHRVFLRDLKSFKNKSGQDYFFTREFLHEIVENVLL